MKGQDLVVAGVARLEQLAAPVQPARLEFPQKRGVPVGAEGMSIAEAVARETFADDDC
jgi:hypothetical protein